MTMHEKFDKIVRQARTVFFGAALAGSSLAFAASQLTAQQPTDVEGVQAERGTPEIKSAPKADDPPFVGFASLSPEDQERALEGKPFNELWRPGVKLTDEGLIDDAKAFLKRALRADYSDEEYLRALNEYIRVANSSSAEDEIRYADIEQTLDEALEIRPNSWRVKAGVAKLLNSLPDVGYMQDGKFVYTRDLRKREDLLSCRERVRARRLQLYADALPLVREELERIGGAEQESYEARLAKSEARNYYLAFARIFQGGAQDYWRQQTLTDLGALPDYLPAANANRENRSSGAPVDEADAPVFFAVPESFEAAKSDGERRQALLNEALERFPNSRGEVNQIRAIEAQEVFGVQTLAGIPFFSSGDSGAEQESRQEGIWALNTLADNETIAKLASGVKRFKLPPEYDYINLWLEVLELYPDDWSALKTLAEEYQNRRQYNKAAKFWERLLDKEKNPENFVEEAQAALSQIVDPRVAIESSSGVAGTKAQIDVRYRNAVGAEIVVKRLNVEEFLKIVRNDRFWQFYGKIPQSGANLRSVNNVVAKLVRQQFTSQKETERIDPLEKKFLDLFDSNDFILDEAARYSVEFEPDPNHFDKVARVDLPVSKPGAYLVEVTAIDGNRDAAVVWLRDVAVVRKPFEDGYRFFALDAQSGEPLVDQTVEFFLVNRDWRNYGELITTKEHTKRTDQSGSVLLSNDEIPRHDKNIVLVVVPKEGGAEGDAAQCSFMDFQDVMPVALNNDLLPNTPSAFLFDRSTYRPNQTAEFKFFTISLPYAAPEETQWAGQEVDYRIIAPNGMPLVHKRVKLDEFGAFSDSFEIPAFAEPGVYSAQIMKSPNPSDEAELWQGVNTFIVAGDYKPESEVTVETPKEPVLLGDSFKASIRVRRSSGEPVANAVVSYSVIRVNYRSDYFPARYWDWFYGRGYWQFTYDYDWRPGWNQWGSQKLPRRYPQQDSSELFAEGKATLNEDGVAEIFVDTSLDRLRYPNDDQQYIISVEATDESGRRFFGSGDVYAARQPFQTYVWFDRGYFRVGDAMNLGFHARRLDGKGVAGAAVVKLYKVEYAETDDGAVKPIETEVFAEKLKTDLDGKGAVTMVAAAPGQYRVSCVVTSDKGVQQEGGQLIVVRGDRAESEGSKNNCRFNPLEIVPDKPEYSAGDVARLQIASSNPDAYVLFTARPYGSITVGEPRFVKLENGVAYVDVPIKEADQPNIFVQATTVFDGKLYCEQKELAVPPERQVVVVDVEPNAKRVKSDANTAGRLRFSDLNASGRNADQPDVQATATFGGKILAERKTLDVQPEKWMVSVDVNPNAERRATVRLRLADVDGKPVVGKTIVYLYDKALEYPFEGVAVGNAREFFGKWRRQAGISAADNLSQGTLRNVFDPIGQFDRNLERQDRLQPIKRFENKITRGDSFTATSYPQNYSGVIQSEYSFDAPMMASSAALAELTSRKNVADLPQWTIDLTPEDDGVVEIEVEIPENLTTWKIAAWSIGAGLRVGSGEAEIVTGKDVILHMQKPRFLTEKDEVVLSATVHNYLDSEKKVRVSLEFPTDEPENSTASFVLMDGTEQTRDVVVPANGEVRVDWSVRADGPGVGTALMKAITDEDSDVVQKTIVVKEQGVQKRIAASVVVPPAGKDKNAKEGGPNVRNSTFTLTIPEERRRETTKLTVRFSPPLADAIFNALPYLADYPYESAEQTLNRFLPTVLAQRALQDAGVDLEALQKNRMTARTQRRSGQWQIKRGLLDDPVFDVDKARQTTAEGVAKLQAAQNGDGGWSQFAGAGERSCPSLTALVVRGLHKARERDRQVNASAIERGKRWLLKYELDQTIRIIRGRVWNDARKGNAAGIWKESADSIDAAVYYALSELGVHPTELSDPSDLNASDPASVHAIMKELIWEARADLTPYSLAIYAIALADEPDLSDGGKLRVETILRQLAQYRDVDVKNQTVRLDLAKVDGWKPWSWYGGEFETQAYFLKLLLRVDEETLEKLGLDKDAPRLVNYLVGSRKNATYWKSTRDTALCVEALAEYLPKTDELASNQTVNVFVDGELKKTVKYSPDALFAVDGVLELSGDELTSGKHEIAASVEGDGPLCCSACLEFFVPNDPSEKTGLDLKVERRYYKLIERKGSERLITGSQRAEFYDRAPLKSGDAVASGDLVEVELVVDSADEYESIVLEDFIPAGFEPTEQPSGGDRAAMRAYVEYLDDRVCFFAAKLEQGRTTVRYQLRAETLGKFSAAPAKIGAMYAPELRGASDEFMLQVVDRTDL